MLPVVVLVSGLLLSLLAAGQANAATSAGPAHSLASARKQGAVAKNKWQHAALGSKAQKDWYRLSVPSRSYLYAMLGNLPANYNLRLYDEAGQQLNASDKAGTSPESIGRMVNAGTYFLRVGSTKGYSKTKKYDLLARVAPSTDTVGVLTARRGNYASSTVVGEVANVSNEWLVLTAMDVSYYNAQGKLLHKSSDATSHPRNALAPGARAPYQVITGDLPSSLAPKVGSVKVRPYWSTSVAIKTPPKMKISGVKRVRHAKNGEVWYDWTGKVTNSSSRRLPDVTVAVIARDKRGVVAGYDSHAWLVIPARTTKKFSATYSNWRSGLTFGVKAYETYSSF